MSARFSQSSSVCFFSQGYNNWRWQVILSGLAFDKVIWKKKWNQKMSPEYIADVRKEMMWNGGDIYTSSVFRAFVHYSFPWLRDNVMVFERNLWSDLLEILFVFLINAICFCSHFSCVTTIKICHHSFTLCDSLVVFYVEGKRQGKSAQSWPVRIRKETPRPLDFSLLARIAALSLGFHHYLLHT